MTEVDCIAYKSTKAVAGVYPQLFLPIGSDLPWWESKGVPEAELITWAVQFLGPKGEFVDAGCHIGSWTIPIAMRGNHYVSAFEPQPHIADLCRRGIEANNCKAKVYTTALGDKVGVATLRAPYIDGGGGSIVCDFPEASIEITVDVAPLDHWDTRPRLFKVDCEASELSVLRGATRTIKRWKPVIILECWADERGQDAESLFRYLSDDLNYKYQQVWPETWLAEPA